MMSILSNGPAIPVDHLDVAAQVIDLMEDPEFTGTYVGRVWNPDVAGPSPVLVTEGRVRDLSSVYPTMRDLIESFDYTGIRAIKGHDIGPVSVILNNSWHSNRNPKLPWFLSPFDLQVVKAAGVTFVSSMIERVIEERALGDIARAADFRSSILEVLGGDLRELKPGSDEAAALKDFLVKQGMWSQYLEVGIGPDAEIFTKGPCLSTVGFGAEVGVAASSIWNNPEPEVVLAISSRGEIVGASVGNDINLRDVEGRSALLLPKAKDNNASGSIGPWLRLFDKEFTIDDLRVAKISMTVTGDDAFRLEATADLAEISRDFEQIVSQLIGTHHQYPDGAALFLGTPFAPIEDRGAIGKGFTHHLNDIVSISTPAIGGLVNQVQSSESCPPWEFGIHSLMTNLASRGLLPTAI